MADPRAGDVALERVSGDVGVTRAWQGNTRHSVADTAWSAGWLAARMAGCVAAVSSESRAREKAEQAARWDREGEERRPSAAGPGGGEGSRLVREEKEKERKRERGKVGWVG